MSKRFAVLGIALIVGLAYSPLLRGQAAPAKETTDDTLPYWNASPPFKEYYAKIKHQPAPKRDLTGLWDGTLEGGTQGKGANAHQGMHAHDRKEGGETTEANIEHPLSYTAAGEAALEKNRPGDGVRMVDTSLVNDPVDFCDPQGFPRMELYELRVVEILQTKKQFVYLDEFDDNFRIVWTDGRPLPNVDDVEKRWNGYSVGRWVDDYTFVVDTVGMDASTWLDNVGRPHTYYMKVQETWHRVDSEIIELTVKIDDPAYYNEPWLGLNKFVLHRLPDNYDMEEFTCSVTQTQEYNTFVSDPAKRSETK